MPSGLWHPRRSRRLRNASNSRAKARVSRHRDLDPVPQACQLASRALARSPACRAYSRRRWPRRQRISHPRVRPTRRAGRHLAAEARPISPRELAISPAMRTEKLAQRRAPRTRREARRRRDDLIEVSSDVLFAFSRGPGLGYS